VWPDHPEKSLAHAAHGSNKTRIPPVRWSVR
jgi:hypothetical protein